MSSVFIDGKRKRSEADSGYVTEGCLISIERVASISVYRDIKKKLNCNLCFFMSVLNKRKINLQTVALKWAEQ